MLYYTVIFLATVLVSALAIWIYRGMLGVARTTYNATMPNRRLISPRAKARLKARKKARVKAASSNQSSISNLPGSIGMAGNSNQLSAHGEVYKPGSTKVLWKGLSNHSGVSEPQINQSQGAAKKSVGWPYKEEKMEFAGKAYKVKRKAAAGDFNDNGKPWVW